MTTIPEIRQNGYQDSLDYSSSEEPDALGTYLAEMGKTPLLSAEEEIDLFEKIEAGLFAQYYLDHNKKPDVECTNEDLKELVRQGKQAHDLMVQANLRLVVSIAQKYQWSRIPLLDLIAEGNFGLFRAIEKFDTKKGNKFSTYSTWWIRQVLSRTVSEKSRMVRIPSNRATKHNQLLTKIKEMTERLGWHPSHEEIATETGMTVQRIKDFLYEAQSETSLDALVGDGEKRLGDIVADTRADEAFRAVEDNLDQAIRSAVLQAALSRLTDQQAIVLIRRNGLDGQPPATFAQIGEEIGMTGEGARKIQEVALAHLRNEKRLLPLLSA